MVSHRIQESKCTRLSNEASGGHVCVCGGGGARWGGGSIECRGGWKIRY